MGICGQERVDHSKELLPIHHTPGTPWQTDSNATCSAFQSPFPGLIIKAAPFFVTHLPAGLGGRFPPSPSLL